MEQTIFKSLSSLLIELKCKIIQGWCEINVINNCVRSKLSCKDAVWDQRNWGLPLHNLAWHVRPRGAVSTPLYHIHHADLPTCVGLKPLYQYHFVLFKFLWRVSSCEIIWVLIFQTIFLFLTSAPVFYYYYWGDQVPFKKHKDKVLPFWVVYENAGPPFGMALTLIWCCKKTT